MALVKAAKRVEGEPRVFFVHVPPDHETVVDRNETVGRHVALAFRQHVREERPYQLRVALPAVSGGAVDDVSLGVERA